MPNKELIQALWSLKEDATHAWKLSLSGDESGIHHVGLAYKTLENVISRMANEQRPKGRTES